MVVRRNFMHVRTYFPLYSAKPGSLRLYTILHISDLHRKGGSAISNEELLSGLVADFNRSSKETLGLTRPDAIVVSGDLVEGLPLLSKSYPDSLAEQYQEAEDLLVSLAGEFLGGDHSRVVLVPGNHDVDWNGARKAFETAEIPGQNPRWLVSDPESGYRWSWSDQQIYRMSSPQVYERRFDFFSTMYEHFYQDVPLAHPVNAKNPWNLFSLDAGNIVVAAFNSCVVNDCFSDLGHIRSKDLADCHLAMRSLARPDFLPVGVWHHGVGGPPSASDYLDPDTVRLMIDKGFRLALHGHRHDSSISPLDLHVSTQETMAVIGAGSLCAGENALPHGVNHRYNVIQVDTKEKTGEVHVREMNTPGIWGPGQLFESGGTSHVNFYWTPSSFEIADQGRSGGYSTAIVDEVEGLIKSGRYQEGIEALLTDSTITATYKRRLLAKALNDSEDWSELKKLLESPQNNAELSMYFIASERSGDMEEVEKVLEDSEASGEFDGLLLSNLRQKFGAHKQLGG